MSKEFLSFTSNDVEITDIKPVYRGFFTMNQYQFKHKCFNGEWSDTVTREIFERGHAVGVLPYDPVLQEFVLIEQVRIGALATSSSPWLIEIIAGMIDLCINFVPSPESYISQIILAVVAVLTVGIGGGIYLVANLGPGPRDGLMIGLQKVSNLPIATVRAFIEISVVSVGWYLGGTVGIGTLLFAFGIGPAVALGLYLVDKIFNN